jgi:hypothetical protein
MDELYIIAKNGNDRRLHYFDQDDVEKWQHDAPEVVSFEQFPTESSVDITNDESTGSTPVTEDRNHAIAVAVATAAAAEAAVAAAQAAAKVVRLAGYGRHSKEERAATLIQSHYRGYLVISFPFLSHANIKIIHVSRFCVIMVPRDVTHNNLPKQYEMSLMWFF